MNATESYKQRIEAIVRPINAMHPRKNTMRRELWAHFVALVEEEGGNAEACERAWLRMGDAAGLRQALDATVTKAERCGNAFDRFMFRSRDEPWGEFARRLGRVFFPIGAVFLAFSATLVAWTEPFERVVSIIAALTPVFAWAYCLVMVLQPAIRYSEDMEAQSLERHPVRKAAVKTVANLGRAFALTPLFYLLGYCSIGLCLGFGHSETLVYLYMAPVLYAGFGGQIAIAILFGLMRAVQSAKVIEHWPYA